MATTRSTLCIQYRSLTGGGVRITGEVTVSALSSPYLSMLRDCKCLVRCQVSVCHKFLGQKALAHSASSVILGSSGVTPSDQAKACTG